MFGLVFIERLNIMHIDNILNQIFSSTDYQTVVLMFNVKEMSIVYSDSPSDIPFIGTVLTDLLKAYNCYPMI